MAKGNGNSAPKVEELDLTGLDPELAKDLAPDQIGFPPYWNPGEGKRFAGVVMMRDERDPQFVRYNIQAATTLMCQEGPADDAMPVRVQKGQVFNVSDYAGLPLSDYFGQFVLVTCIRKVPLDGGKTVWKFQLESNTPGRLQAAGHRAARLAAAREELPKELQG